MNPRRPSMFFALLLASGSMAAACSSGPAATSTSTTSTPSGAGGRVHIADGSPPAELPTSCKLAPRLGPVTQTPTWPTGYQILDAVPNDLIAQFPTVYGGLVVAPAKSGESAVQINSHFIVLETMHDPTLESEVRAAYPAAISVAFALTPWSLACLNDTAVSVNSGEMVEAKAGISVLGNGIQRSHVVVQVTACSPSSERAARDWFLRRWGAVVSIQTCQKPAVAQSANASL